MFETFRFWSESLGGPIGREGVFRDNQGSFHKDVESPSPMARPKREVRRSRPIRIPRHPWDVDEVMGTFRKSLSLQYLPRRILLRRHDGFLRILQLILAIRESLKL
ncbi:unnamed protein product [Microthlaspi erraticum]|uniref:Uncharacterized protein n=1 Tax=Microthlaspi erraticum TaxID=1685480 RepID=A0A6D2L6F9_9BRAS|nr:unnamed protein product [Microthlaspi erraticum]